MNSEAGLKPFRCGVCESTHSTLKDYNRHRKYCKNNDQYKADQKSPKLFHCKNCYTQFTDSQKYSVHVKSRVCVQQPEVVVKQFTPQSPWYRCRMCYMAFTEQKDYDKHVESKECAFGAEEEDEQEELPCRYKCMKCPAILSNKEDLKAHKCSSWPKKGNPQHQEVNLS